MSDSPKRGSKNVVLRPGFSERLRMLREEPPAATPTSPTCGRVNFLHPAGDGTGAF